MNVLETATFLLTPITIGFMISSHIGPVAKKRWEALSVSLWLIACSLMGAILAYFLIHL